MIWKFYLGIMGFFVGGSLPFLAFDEPHAIHPWAEYIFVPASAVQVVALYGFVFRRSILSARFWQLAFPAFVLNLIVALFVGGTRLAADQGDVELPAATVFLSMFVLPLLLPLLLANYRYAFRSPAVWGDRSGHASHG